jgi:ABC-type phosphate/phosphonate transport system ATPase subunit
MDPFPEKALIRVKGLTRLYSLGSAAIVGIQNINLKISRGELVVLKGVN